MTTAYLGTSAFAAAVLERLAATDHRPALVVTRPDRAAGRGRKLTPPPVATTARELGLELFQPESINTAEAGERVAASGADVVVVCAFGAIIKEPLLSDFELLNVHPSLLPRWRGAAPIERAIMAGDEETGVSIMRVTEGLDAGPVDRPRLGGTPQADGVRAKALAAFGDLRDASPTRHAAAIRAPVLAGYAAADRIVPASQGRDLKRALPGARVIELGRGDGPRFVHASVPPAALRSWWSAVRAELQRAAWPRR